MVQLGGSRFELQRNRCERFGVILSMAASTNAGFSLFSG
jgi:hypothetical protein